MRNCFLLLALLGAPFLSLASPLLADSAFPTAEASVSIQLSIQQLTTFADRVAIASSVENLSIWESTDDGGQRIVTYHRVRLERSIVGEGSQELWVRTLGGIVGTIGQRVDGEAVIPKGQRVLLFLKKSDDNNYFVIGLGQGVYHVERGTDGIDRVKRSSSGGLIIRKFPNDPQIIDRPLDEVASTIRSLKASHAQ